MLEVVKCYEMVQNNITRGLIRKEYQFMQWNQPENIPKSKYNN